MAMPYSKYPKVQKCHPYVRQILGTGNVVPQDISRYRVKKSCIEATEQIMLSADNVDYKHEAGRGSDETRPPLIKHDPL